MGGLGTRSSIRRPRPDMRAPPARRRQRRIVRSIAPAPAQPREDHRATHSSCARQRMVQQPRDALAPGRLGFAAGRGPSGGARCGQSGIKAGQHRCNWESSHLGSGGLSRAPARPALVQRHCQRLPGWLVVASSVDSSRQDDERQRLVAAAVQTRPSGSPWWHLAVWEASMPTTTAQDKEKAAHCSWVTMVPPSC